MSENTEKTLNLDKVRLYRTSTVLGEFGPKVRISYLNPVEVCSGKVRIGWASLDVWTTPLGQRIVKASLVFDYETPERLSIETRSEKLYARAEAYMDFGDSDGLYLYSSSMKDIQEIQITGVEIDKLPGYVNQPALGEAVF